jgi:hypothetical protein
LLFPVYPGALKHKGWLRTNHPKGEVERSIPCSPPHVFTHSKKTNKFNKVNTVFSDYNIRIYERKVSFIRLNPKIEAKLAIICHVVYATLG